MRKGTRREPVSTLHSAKRMVKCNINAGNTHQVQEKARYSCKARPASVALYQNEAAVAHSMNTILKAKAIWLAAARLSIIRTFHAQNAKVMAATKAALDSQIAVILWGITASMRFSGSVCRCTCFLPCLACSRVPWCKYRSLYWSVQSGLRWVSWGHFSDLGCPPGSLTIAGKVFSFSLRLDLVYGPGRGVHMHFHQGSERSDASWR